MGQPGGPHASESPRFETGHATGLVAQCIEHAARRGEGLIEADGHGYAAGELGVRHEVGRGQRLLDAQQAELGQPVHLLGILHPIRTVGVDLENQRGMVATHDTDRLDVPAGFDLEPDPGRPGRHGIVHLGPQYAEVMVERDPHCCADRERLIPGTEGEGVGQRSARETQLRVGDGHFEDGTEHAIDR